MIQSMMQLSNYRTWAIVVSLCSMLLGIYSVCKVFCGNPGIPSDAFTDKPQYVKQQEGAPLDRTKWCAKCLVYQNPHADSHCKDCDVCIRGFDHHCIFYGKCIGQGNKFWFDLSLFNAVFSLLFTFVVYGYQVVTI